MNQRDNAACLESLQRFVDQAMVPLALEGFQSMYKQGEEIRLSQSAENLTNAGIMLQLLDEVRTWTQVLLDEEVRRIEARIPYLQKLLTALFVMKVKVLSCINMRKVTTEFPLTIPSSHTFVHNMYIHAARALADNISIVDDMRMSNMRELISDALRRAEFDCLRWDELLTWGLDGVDPSDALRDMLTSTPADVDTDERPASFEPPRSTTVDNVDDEDSEFRTIANEDKADPPEHADDAADDGPMSSDDFPPLNASDSEHDDTRNVSTAEPAQNDADANADDSTAEPTQKAFW